MVWLAIVIAGYFFGALANIGDKFLLGSKRISSPPVYAFYVGLFGLFAFILAPFGLTIPSSNVLIWCLVSGLIFAFGILLLFFAIEKAEASRVTPVVGAVVPLATFFFSGIAGTETLGWLQSFGIILLVLGGLLISFDLPLKIGKRKFFSGFHFAIGAGFFLAAAYLLFKNISNQESSITWFITWYIWTRMGALAGAGLLLLVPIWRKNIFKSFHSAKKNKKQTISTGAFFLGNKTAGGISTLLFNYAIGIGSVTLTNALISIQYVFVLVLVSILHRTKAHIFQEKLLFWDWAQKVAAIFIIGVGIFLIYE